MPRPQFTLRALLVAMLVVAAFFGGVEFGRVEGQRRFEAERARLLREAMDMAEASRQGQERAAKMWPADATSAEDASAEETVSGGRP